MFRKLMIGALAVATLAAPVAASAQDWRRGDRDRDGQYERWERRSDRNRQDGGRYTDRERYNDYRRGQRDQYRDGRPPYGNAYGYRQHRWQRGHAIPREYRSRWYVNDYRRYGYAPPPRGYGYYRTDSGDVVMAASATGVIISLLSR